MRKFSKILSFGMAFLCGVAIAATTWEVNQQPFGHLAPPALSKVNLTAGDAVTFVPWFERYTFRGDLLAGATSSTGSVNLMSPLWRAGTVLDAMDWNLDRKIFTMHADGYPVPFRQDDIHGDQLKELDGDKNERLDFLRGDRSEEGGKFDRERVSVLGDIVHSNPNYVAAPRAGYAGDGYPAFAYANRDRAGMVYVGANDGMLHAFDAETGTERWAYVPSILFETLGLLAEYPYIHQYYVDGPITVEDAQKADGTWYTALVGGLGAGGRAYYALDVTSATAPATEAAAASKLMWEFTENDEGDLNYTYARPSIVKLNDGIWYAVVGSGYMGSKKAKLFIINLETGALTREIEVDGGGDNGLSSPTLIDIDKNGTADYAYAGDLNGNMWKFDLSSTSPLLWQPAFVDKKIPLFTAEEGVDSGEFQAITTAPEIGKHPTNGLMVYFGTGRLFSVDDLEGYTATQMQSVYGIRDNNWAATDVPIADAQLLKQSLRRNEHTSSGQSVRTATDYAINWSTHKGWRTDLRVAGALPEEIGERVTQDMTLKSGRVQFLSTNPVLRSGSNYYMQLDAMNGGAPGAPIMDLNGDNKFSVLDNVDGDANGAVEEVAQDRVVGVYQGFGLTSRPTLGIAAGGGDAAILNHLYTTDPNSNPETDNNPDPPDDPGFVGGHIDVDTSTAMYAFDDGETNKHEHQWDDSHNATIVDFFDLYDDSFDYIGDPGLPTTAGNPFIVNLANAHLSPGGVIEINGIGIPVKDYRALIKRAVAGNLGPDESVPVFKLGTPTAAESAAGVQELTSLKMAFATDALLLGGVHPTATGCVKGNEPGQNGEYRNGALTIQALDASDVAGGYTYDAATDVYHTGSHAIHNLGYGFPNNGATALEDDGTMYWETTIFWHWGGGCFGIDDKESYDENFAADVSTTDRGTDGDISGDPPPDPDPEPDPDPDPEDTGYTLDPTTSTVNVAASDDTGRLSWQELVPDNN